MLTFLSNNYCRYFCRNICHSVEGNFKKAIVILNLLQNNRQNVLDARTNQYATDKLQKFKIFLEKCELNIYELEQQLSIIHVSGTKGKGSSCAFCESILRSYGYKTGFFSSPHLVSVQERIRINGQPINREQFASHFWDLYGKLKHNLKLGDDVSRSPSYFMFLTIMAYKVFKEEKVDVAIIETGIGGEYDCTNILKKTAVVGISSLGYDHVALLGNTLEEIAWQKAGIMKPGAITIIAPDQPTVTLNILQKRAIERECFVFSAPYLEEYIQNYNNINLGIKGPPQPKNASLALQLASAWMNPENYRTENYIVRKAPIFEITENMLTGLKNSFWPGRTQIFNYSQNLTYHLDGAHNVDSIQYCVSWFQENSHSSYEYKKILMFNMIGNRDVQILLAFLLQCQFDYVLFCPNIISYQYNNNDLLCSDNIQLNIDIFEEYQRSKYYYELWFKINKSADESNTKLFPNVTEALTFIEHISCRNRVDALITGSLYLVGACLSILDPQLNNNNSLSSNN